MKTTTHLRNIVNLFQPESANRFSFNGKTYFNQTNVFDKTKNASDTYIRLLQNAIYEQYYLRRTQELPELELTSHEPENSGQNSSFAESLRAANRSVSNWNAGWKIDSKIPKNLLLVSRGDEQLTISENSFRETPGSTQKTGSVFCPHEFFPPNAAFYFVFSNLPSVLQNTQIVRFYFHLRSEASAGLIDWVTTVLNKYEIPFQFKCLSSPEFYGRPDSGVLYVNKKNVPAVYELLCQDAGLLLPKVQSGVPVFSLPLFEGIGFAENPLNGESFGMARALSLAGALYGVWQHHLSNENAFLHVEKQLLLEGYRFENFHLNPFTQMPYSFQKNS